MNGNLSIQNGVSIIFGYNPPTSNEIIINGGINCGCSDYEYLNSPTQSGLVNTTNYVNISGKASIEIESGSTMTKFCNTKFSNMDYAI